MGVGDAVGVGVGDGAGGQGLGETFAPVAHTSWRVGAGGVAPYLREVRRVLLHSHRQRAIRPFCVAAHHVVVRHRTYP